MTRVLALIPARGGSKGIPEKNLAPIGGHPLVAFAVAAARQARVFADIVINTERRDIADAACAYGAAAPFLRPPALAGDSTPMIDVVQDAVARLEALGSSFDMVCLLQPTTPFRDPAALRAAVRLLGARADCTACVGVTPVIDSHPSRLRRITDGFLTAYLDGRGDHERQQRQDHGADPAYRRCGAFYLFRTATLRAGSLYGDKVLPCIVDGAAAVTIDDPLDLAMARTLWEQGADWPEVAAMRAALAACAG